jgi:leucyl aminopeptidase (aminopeptidase T)
MTNRDGNLNKACRAALERCVAVKPGETVLIVTDTPLTSIGQSFFEAALEIGSEAILIEIPELKMNGEEPPGAVAELMKKMNVIVAPTSRSLTHTAARLAATRAGARIITLPDVTSDILMRSVEVDYVALKGVTDRLADALTRAKTARVTCPQGTDLTMSLKGRKGYSDNGVVHQPGAFSNFPAGEAFVAPLEGTATGTVVFNGPFASLGALVSTVRLEVEDGQVTRARGTHAQALMRKMEPAGRPGRNVAELGIGTNPRAIVSGKTVEDEKVLGTAHVAIGNNKNFGGKSDAPYHWDGIITNATLWLDGEECSARDFF